MKKNYKIYFALCLLVLGCTREENNYKSISCQPDFKMCLETSYGNDYKSLVDSEWNHKHIFEIVNYNEKCFNSYDLVGFARSYKNKINDTSVTRIGFCKSCPLEVGMENSERWGAVRKEMLYSLLMLPDTINKEISISGVTYYIDEKPHWVSFWKK